MRQSSLDTDFIRVQIRGEEAGEAADPTVGTDLALAFTAVDPSSRAEPDPSDDSWHPGAWEIDPTTDPTTYYARILVGPEGGELELSKGDYVAWVRWQDNPERPVLRSPDIITIF